MSKQHYNASELLGELLDRSDSVTEFTQSLQISTEFMTIMSKEEKRKQDEVRKNYLMQRILEYDGPQLGMSSREHPPLKSMTVTDLEDYSKKLSKQASSNSIRLVS
ncbi:MAG: hypothetical protein AB4057_03175 [Crocosphaera sp.]